MIASRSRPVRRAARQLARVVVVISLAACGATPRPSSEAARPEARPQPRPPLLGVDLLRPDGSWTRMRRDGCEVRTAPVEWRSFTDRTEHAFRCGDATAATEALDRFDRSLVGRSLRPEPAPRAPPARREHRAVVEREDGTRWVVLGPWREVAQRAQELGAAWDAVFAELAEVEGEEPEQGEATDASLTLWTALEANDDAGGPLHVIRVGTSTLRCVVELDSPAGRGVPEVLTELPELAIRLRDEGADCGLMAFEGCLRTGCGEATAARWLELQDQLPSACRLPCEGTSAPPADFDSEAAASIQLREWEATQHEREDDEEEEESW